MGKSTIIQKLKDIIYKIVLPIYLWSIDFKTLDDYIKAIVIDYQENLYKNSYKSPDISN